MTWKKLTVLMILLMFLVSCAKEEELNANERMQLVERTAVYTIYCDSWTRILYIKSTGGVFTVMVDREGLPMILPEKADTGVKNMREE